MTKAVIKFNGPLSTSEGIEAGARIITATIQDALSASTIEVPVTTNRREPLPIRLQRMLKRKRKLRELWANTRCPMVKRDLNKLAEKLSGEMSAYRGASWDAVVDQAGESQRSLHHLNRLLTRTKSTVSPLYNKEGKLCYPAEDRAEILAECMETQFTPHPANPAVSGHHRLVEDRVREFLNNPTPSIEGLVFIPPTETRKAAQRLVRRKAPGLDGIPNAALARLPGRALVAVTRLFNGILRTGHFPNSWKRGKIIALPKPGKDRRRPENYRPITLLPTLAKLFERLVVARLYTSLPLRDEQFGFRSGHSTTLQLARVLHHVADETNRRRHTVGVFLDIEKAFDRVWHEGLVFKLLQAPVPDMLVRLVASFLDGREFTISVEGVNSSLKPIRAGVPQGSCLSPRLYAFYTDDIPTLRESLQEWEDDAKLALFADDSAYFTSSINLKQACKKMQRLLNHLPEWLDKWKIAVNVGKTVPVLFSPSNKEPPQLHLREKALEWKPTVRYLGCYIDRSLKMKAQVDHLISQARAARAMLRPVLASNLPIKTKLGIYKTYIRSRLTYAAPAWYVLAARTHRKRLQSQQNLALRTIVGAGRYVRNEVIRRDLKVQTLKQFVVYLARGMYYRADEGPHPHLRGIAPLHTRPPDKRKLPRELLAQDSDSE